ncbi:MAG: hypothetical protein AAF586_05440 [Planctomycetota bacterium]
MDVKQAVRVAIEHLRDLFAQDVVEMPGEGDFRLEEVRLDEDDHWLITISFLRNSPAEPPVKPSPPTVMSRAQSFLENTVLIGFDGRREYKVVEIDDAGKIISVSMRALPVSA